MIIKKGLFYTEINISYTDLNNFACEKETVSLYMAFVKEMENSLKGRNFLDIFSRKKIINKNKSD